MATDRAEAPDRAAFTEYDDLSSIELVRALDALQQEKERIEGELGEVQKRFDFVRIVRVPEQFDSEGITSLTVEGVGRCTLTADLHASIAKERKNDAWQWLRDNGHGDLITETVAAGSLKSAVKEMLKKGEEVPSELFNVTPFTRASITRRGVK